MPMIQSTRLMELHTPLGEDVLLIKRLSATEGISQLFSYDLEILHEEGPDAARNVATTVDPRTVIGKPMSVTVGFADSAHRFFHGICVHFSQGNRNREFSKYRAQLVPAVWLLTQVHRSRIFQQKSVPEILRILLEGFEVNFELQGSYEPRDYCVQYRESDWNFASRLMEEEGIFYFFEHTADSHRLIVADTPQSHRDCPIVSTFPFTTDISPIEEDTVGAVHTWRVDNKLRSGKYTLWDHNFELPTANLEASQVSRFDIGGNQNLEVYDFPGEYAKRFAGIDPGGGEQPDRLQKVFEDRRRTVQIRQQEIDVAYENIYATSDAYTMTAGHRFTLENHPEASNNISHVLVHLKIDVVQSPAYVTDEDIGNPYLVNFVCIPQGGRAAPFRPLRKTPKPVIHGSQTAVVVGPGGEEIFTDKYGRVKVQFEWDREGRMDAGSSCWIRVAQSWAGNKWGTMFIPRIGMEVVVSFLEGDPDQPIITGCVYNPQTMPPYVLPDEKTKSTIKSNSSKGGSGFNEFRFEDKKGSEQIFIHAEKNQDIRVKNDCKETVLHDRHLIVENDQFEKVKRDKHLQVTGDHNEKIGGTMSLSVGSDQQNKVGTNYALEAGMAVHMKAGLTTVIEAGMSLTLKAGGSSININPGGIQIIGSPMLLLNSGGSPASGAGCNPTAPTEAKAAATAEAGQATQSRRPGPAPASPEFKKQAAQARKTAKKKNKSGLVTMGEYMVLLAALQQIQDQARFEAMKEQGKDIAEQIAKSLVATAKGLPFVSTGS